MNKNNPNFMGTTTDGSYASTPTTNQSTAYGAVNTPPQINPVNPNNQALGSNFGTPIVPSTPPVTTLNASELGNVKPINLPQLQVPTVPDITTLSIDQQAQNFAQNQIPEQPTAAETENATLKARFLAAYEKMTGKKAAQLNAESQTGLTQFKTQLNDINSQIRQLQADAVAQTLSLQGQGRGIPQSILNNQAAQIERNRAVKALGLSAIAQTLQGNIALAQDLADRAVEAEFAPVQAEIDYLKQAIDLNYEDLSREDKKRADTQKLVLEERQRLIDEQKTTKQAIQKMAVEAAQNGDTAAANRIMASSTIEEALKNAGTALRDPYAYLDGQIKEAQLAKLRAEITPGNNVSTGTVSNITSLLQNTKVGQGTRTSIGTIMGVINATEDLAKARPSGKFAGFNPIKGLFEIVTPNAWKSSERIENEGYIDAINLKVQQWASGASLTKQQIEQVNKMVPKRTDSDRVVQTKLNNLVNFMNQQIKGTLQSEGISYEPEKVDLFKADSLQAIFE